MSILHVGSGQEYNGTDEIAINNAIKAAKSGDTIQLHPATYNIKHMVLLKSGIKMQGEGEKTLIFGTAANVCHSSSEQSYIHGSDISDVEIYNIAFQATSNGPCDNGKGEFRNCMQFKNCKNITIDGCIGLRWTYCDFFRFSDSSNMIMRNCKGISGHSMLYGYKSDKIKAYNNTIMVATNAGLRLDNCTNAEFYNNTINCYKDSGQAAIELQHNVAGLNIHHNVIYDMANCFAKHCVVQNAGGASGSCNFQNNVYWNSPGGVEYGFKDPNIVDPSDRCVENWKKKGYGAAALQLL